MKFKKLNFIICFSVMFLLFLVSPVKSQELDEYLDPQIPESWYEAPQVASELGIDTFNQSPMLDNRVNEGELPSVKDRLPNNPPVVEPYSEIGTYGGTAILWKVSNWGEPWNEGQLAGFFGFPRYMGRATPDVKKVVPYVIKDWEYSNDYKTFKIHLREGVRWSDGHPFTADDYLYWWEHIANNKDLNPVSPEEWKPPIINVEKLDNYTVVFNLGETSPFFNRKSLLVEAGKMTPKHYMKQFHPDFVEKEKLMEKVKEAGFENWFEYYEYKNTLGDPDRGVRPTLRPYVVVRTEENYQKLERNPYFPFVDTEGNQLPYIDNIKLQLANSNEMMASKITTGESTIATRLVFTRDIPMYKKYEEEGNYRTLIYKGAGKNWAVTINQTHEDPKLREIFQKDKFRKALSLGLDRDRINRKVFYGEATVRQGALFPGSKYSEPEYAEAYIEHNPEKAKEFLDEIGMKDVNDDGFREYPDGEDFILILENWHEQLSPMGELIKADWEKIGIETQYKLNNFELSLQRMQANKNQAVMTLSLASNTDLLFPVRPGCIAPVDGWPSSFTFRQWIQWYNTNGQEGLEPPDRIKKLQDYADTLMYSSDEDKRIEAGKKLAKSQAENIWMIGVVGLKPMPIMADNNLRNIPESGYYGASTGEFKTYYPIQSYLKE